MAEGVLSMKLRCASWQQVRVTTRDPVVTRPDDPDGTP